MGLKQLTFRAHLANNLQAASIVARYDFSRVKH